MAVSKTKSYPATGRGLGGRASTAKPSRSCSQGAVYASPIDSMASRGVSGSGRRTLSAYQDRS